MPVSVAGFLWKHLSKLKTLFFVTLAAQVIAELCIQVGIYYSSRIVGALSDNSDKAEAFKYALYFAIMFAVFNFMRGLIHNLTAFTEAVFLPSFYAKVAKTLFARAHRHSLQFFSEEMSGRIATKVRQTIRELSDFYGNAYKVNSSLLKAAITFVFLIRVDWLLALLLFLFFGAYITFLYFTAEDLIGWSEESHDRSTIANGVLVDTMFNHTLIRNYSRLFFERLNYFKKLRDWVKVEKVVYIKEAYMYMYQAALRAILQMLFLLTPLFYWINDKISVADFVLVEGLTSYIALYCMDVVGSTFRAFRCWGGIKDGLVFLYRPVHVVDKPDAPKLVLRKAAIHFKNVSFGYKSGYDKVREDGIEPLLFQHFNLDIEAGEKIGLVGHSGSGKSSITKILCRYYDVSDGKILINKTNIANVTQDSLRQNIAVIPQDPSLFNRSILENISYGKPAASLEEIIKAAKKAYCHDFITKLPKGYDTRVGERGVTLSGGERQRIAIARAILKNAPILILDEATSALDSESEIYIQKALADVMKGKTVIAIAHRLSTLREMDRLIVLDNGKIIEEGTHTSLMKNKGAYHDFYQLQALSFRR